MQNGTPCPGIDDNMVLIYLCSDIDKPHEYKLYYLGIDDNMGIKSL